MANFIGGTTKQFEFDTKGRARHAASPPAIMCSISTASGTKSGFGERGADMLGGAGAAGVDRVEVHLAVVGDVAGNHGALQEVDVVQPVGDAGGVVQVLQGGFAVAAAVDIDQVHRRPGGAVMHPVAGQMQVVARVAAVQGDVAGGHRQHVLDQRAGKADAPVVAQDRARAGQDLDARGRRVGQADLLQRPQGGLVDAGDAGLGQGLVLAAGQAGPDRADVLRKRCGAQRVARGAATGTAGGLVGHGVGSG